MTGKVRAITPAQRARRTYLIAVLIGWLVVDVFDGPVFAGERVEHWVEAAFWAAAALGYVALGRLRPPAAEHRLAEWVIPGGMAVVGATLALRATLSDATAFWWGIALTAGYLVVVWFTVRHSRRTRPANEPRAL